MPNIQIKRGLSTALFATNPILVDGEIVFETDTKKFKLGDGSTSWNNLPYAVGTVNGTQNYIAKFNTSGSGVINSAIYDNGTNIGIGTTSPTEKLEVSGNIKANNIIHPFLLGGM